jgi:hypothetical protein
MRAHNVATEQKHVLAYNNEDGLLIVVPASAFESWEKLLNISFEAGYISSYVIVDKSWTPGSRQTINTPRNDKNLTVNVCPKDRRPANDGKMGIDNSFWTHMSYEGSKYRQVISLSGLP